MNVYEKSLEVMESLFARDCLFSLATSAGDAPTVRVVDAYYQEGAFYVVAYTSTQKARDIAVNPNVAMCDMFKRFSGKAEIIGHPLDEKNREIREKLIKVFEGWYFLHNNESDAEMCYIKITPEKGFFHKDKVGYRVDFAGKSAESIPFSPED